MCRTPLPRGGNVISYGRNLVLSGGWWATTFAGVTILLTVLSLNILAEGLTDAMVNPKLRRAPVVKDDDGSTAVLAVDTEIATSVAQPSVVEEHELDGVRAASGGTATSDVGTSAVLTDVKLAAATRTSCWTANWNCWQPLKRSARTASRRSLPEPATSWK